MQIDFFLIGVAVFALYGGSIIILHVFFQIRKELYLQRKVLEMKKRIEERCWSLFNERFLLRPWKLLLPPWRLNVFLQKELVEELQDIPDEAFQKMVAQERNFWKVAFKYYVIVGILILFGALTYIIMVLDLFAITT